MNRLGAERRPFLFVIDYKQDQVIVEEPDQVDPEVLLYDLDGVTNAAAVSRMNDRENPASAIRWETFPMTQEAYADSFHKVVGHIRAGNSYLANMTCATPVRTDLSLKDVFVRSEARYKLWMKDRFVVFSPEIFVKIRDEHIYSFPMKGTIDATLPDARRRILDDPKEMAEHATIVDLIRNDLSMVATEVMVARYRYIDEPLISTVSRKFDIVLNIIFSDIAIVQNAPIGGTVAIISGGRDQITQAIAYLSEKNVGVEVIKDARVSE